MCKSHYFLDFKVLILLGVEEWNQINDKYGNKDAHEDIVLVAYQMLDGGKMELLIV